MKISGSGDLRAAVDQLRRIQPSPILGTQVGNGSLRKVRLSAWADEVAADLHRRFPALQIVVGCQRYPDRIAEHDMDLDAYYSNVPILDSRRVEVRLDGALTVVSGYDGRHRMLTTNHTDKPLDFWTNGVVTAHVVDPSTLRVVGVSVVAQTAALVRFRVEAQDSVLIPLLVGTASVDPGLGYRVPSGTWALRASLKMGSTLPASLTDYLSPSMTFEVV